MKTGLVITGALLLIIGALITMGMISVPDTKEVLSIGDNSLTVETQKKPSSTLGYVLLGVGGLVTVIGATRKR